MRGGPRGSARPSKCGRRVSFRVVCCCYRSGPRRTKEPLIANKVVDGKAEVRVRWPERLAEGLRMGLTQESPFFPVASDRVIRETANCVAFLDRYPVSEGHALVVPREPVSSLYALDETIQAEIWDLARQVRDVLLRRFAPDGFTIGVNDGAAAGQTVPHAHVHVIPRYAGDSPDPRGGIRWVLPEKAEYWPCEGGGGR